MSTRGDGDDDTDTPVAKTEPLPSAHALHALTQLAKQEPSAKRHASAWAVVTSAAGNPDAHAVLDFACENELGHPLPDHRR